MVHFEPRLGITVYLIAREEMAQTVIMQSLLLVMVAVIMVGVALAAAVARVLLVITMAAIIYRIIINLTWLEQAARAARAAWVLLVFKVASFSISANLLVKEA